MMKLIMIQSIVTLLKNIPYICRAANKPQRIQSYFVYLHTLIPDVVFGLIYNPIQCIMIVAPKWADYQIMTDKGEITSHQDNLSM